jgi:hypothetical protein
MALFLLSHSPQWTRGAPESEPNCSLATSISYSYSQEGFPPRQPANVLLHTSSGYTEGWVGPSMGQKTSFWKDTGCQHISLNSGCQVGPPTMAGSGSAAQEHSRRQTCLACTLILTATVLCPVLFRAPEWDKSGTQGDVEEGQCTQDICWMSEWAQFLEKVAPHVYFQPHVRGPRGTLTCALPSL